MICASDICVPRFVSSRIEPVHRHVGRQIKGTVGALGLHEPLQGAFCALLPRMISD